MLATKEQLQKWMEAGRQGLRVDRVGTIEDTLRNNSQGLIRDNEIKNCTVDLGHKTVGGFSFKLYQPVYKAQPIGMIHDIGVIVDGEEIPREDIQLILAKGCQRIMLYNARTIQDIWWNTIDPITVFVHKEGGLPAGNHELEVTIAEQIMAYYEHPLNMVMGNIKVTMKVD
jgi:hypothetical protein